MKTVAKPGRWGIPGVLVALVLLAADGSMASAMASSSGAVKTETASSGNVSAALSYVERRGRYRNLRIRITRAGVSARDDPVPCGPMPSFQCSGAGDYTAPLDAGSGKSIKVLNLDDDAEPEVIADFFTGGVYCCTFSVVYDFSNGSGYSRIVRDWGVAGYQLRDLGGTQAQEFSSHDYRFDGAFCAHVCSDYPIQIWRFGAGGFADVTRSFPAIIRSDAARHWRLFRRLRHKQGEDLKGILAAYLADQYLLGRARPGWHRLRLARRAGYLNGGSPPHGARYLAKLRRFLRRSGYLHESRAAPRAAPTCAKSAARKAILSSSFGTAIKRKLHRWVKAGAGPILGYGIWKLLCADVTRDGRKEMIAALTCCTSDTPTPWAIFGQKGSGWRPIFQVVSRKLSLWGLRVSAAGDVIEKLPRFKPGDARCCPSAFSYRVTHWNGTRFVVRRAASAAAARSEPCGRIDIEYPHGQGGSSAIGIRASRVDCSKARRIVASDMEGVLTHGWRARSVNDQSVYQAHCLLTSGHRRITYHIAGGGDCGVS